MFIVELWRESTKSLLEVRLYDCYSESQAYEIITRDYPNWQISALIGLPY